MLISRENVHSGKDKNSKLYQHNINVNVATLPSSANVARDNYVARKVLESLFIKNLKPMNKRGKLMPLEQF